MFRYLILESQGDNELEKLKSNIKAIYFDHIQHTLKNVENCFPHIHGFTDEQVKQTIADVKAKKAEYYDEAGCRTIKKFPTSVLTILTNMAKKTNDKNEISNIRSFYHFYDIYSKYEHPGEFSFSLIHQQYREQTQQSFANDIVYVITVLIIPTMSSMLGLWQNIYRAQEKPYMDLVAKISNASSTFHRTFQKQK